jgi:hypothetical protein
MQIYAIYYVDDGDRDYFMRRADALNCGVEYILQICEEENWDPQETESLVDEFLREEWVADICALNVIEVKE